LRNLQKSGLISLRREPRGVNVGGCGSSSSSSSTVVVIAVVAVVLLVVVVVVVGPFVPVVPCCNHISS
jgi:hypothetical protein